MTIQVSPNGQEIEDALRSNITALQDALRDMLAALCHILIAIISFIHASLRIAFAWMGLLLWVLTLVIHLLYGLEERTVKRSYSTLHRR